MGINRAKCGHGVVVILQPKPLICGIALHVIGVCDIKFNHKPIILQGSWVHQDGILKSNADKAPFTCGRIPDVMGDEEQFVDTQNDSWREICNGRR